MGERQRWSQTGKLFSKTFPGLGTGLGLSEFPRDRDFRLEECDLNRFTSNDGERSLNGLNLGCV